MPMNGKLKNIDSTSGIRKNGRFVVLSTLSFSTTYSITATSPTGIFATIFELFTGNGDDL
jgi:hypothetical protein